MSQLVKAALLASVVGLAAQAHATNVAVADWRVAIMASAEAKRTIESFNSGIKPQLDQLKQLEEEIKVLKARYEKDSSVMAEADKKKLQSDYQTKVTTYTSIQDGLDKRAEEMQAQIFKALLPKTEKVIAQLRVEGKYDLIVERRNVVVAADPSLDLTEKIVKRLDSAK